ncbi:MAG: helix-turn-helix domain-containing protein [Pseudolabrys sp.]|jgi:transcriptional regulator GlxA family with amidase domain
MTTAHNLLMLAFPQAQLLDIAGPLQMFAAVNEALGREAYRIEIAAPQSGPFATSSGVSLVADLSFAQVTSKRLARADTLMVAGGNPGVREQLADGAITQIVRKAAGCVPRLSSVCSGAFFLAAAGVLDGRRATTHWDAIEALKRFRPAIDVEGDAIHIEDRGVWTSAGVTAGMDLALAMIEADHGRAVALSIARRHVIFRIRPGGQSQFSAELAAQSVTGSAKIEKLAQSIVAAPSRNWCTDALAAEAGVSQRSLSRLFRAGLDVSPADFVERVRVDLARRRLLDTEEPIDTVAFGCGFGSLRRMDRAFARTIAVSPTEFRARFKATGQQPCQPSTSDLSSFPS